MGNELSKPISDADRPGFIYCFQVVEERDGLFLFKVGRTCRALRKRMREWSRCSSREQRWYLDAVWVDHCHKVERLVHLALMELGHDRVEEYCDECDAVHIEIFGIRDPNAWTRKIKPLILGMNRLVNWMYSD
ncbi:hypothetical protein MPER_12959 [Moniliophthora perniciosa FA553]|nr:hypothetical protein MPER_12959 [Moniliophthora perniciosa FA553]